MKKWFILLLCLFLVACSEEVKTAKTPEEALQIIESDKSTVTITNIITSSEISEDEMFYIFEGNNNRGTEWYVAYVQKMKADSWAVIEAISIGLPSSSDYINYSGGNTFRAGIRTEGDYVEENAFIVPIPNSNYFVTIELIS